MINEALYNKTVNILVDAYFNDTLISNDCTACACGNLIAAANSYKRVEIHDEAFWMTPDGVYINPIWQNVVYTRTYTFLNKKKAQLCMWNYNQFVKKEIESTGYRLHDFAKIEHAFEVGYKGKDKMFNALMSVIDILDEIHENTDAIVSTQTKQKFNKQLA